MTIEIKYEAMHLRHVFNNERCFCRGSSALKKKNNIDEIHEKGRKINKLFNEKRPY